MEKKLTLRDVIDNINHIAAVLTERINKVDTKFNSFDAKFNGKFDSLEAKFDSRFDMLEKRVGSLEYHIGGIKIDMQEIKERTARIELITHHTQKDADAFHGEMRGIHKVIDRFNGRVMRLETHAGFIAKNDGE
jgi:archaellum component FlaC